MSEIRATVKDFILKEFLPGEDPNNLTDTTPLIAGGILDSLATVKLVAFLEERYGIEIAPHETDEDYLGTLKDIEKLVESKL